MPDVFIPGFNSPVEEFDCFVFKLTHLWVRVFVLQPRYTKLDCIGVKRFLYPIPLLLTLHHCNHLIEHTLPSENHSALMEIRQVIWYVWYVPYQ